MREPRADDASERLLTVYEKQESCQPTNSEHMQAYMGTGNVCQSRCRQGSGGTLTVVLGSDEAYPTQSFAEALFDLALPLLATKREKMAMRRLFRIFSRHPVDQSSGVDLESSPLLSGIGNGEIKKWIRGRGAGRGTSRNTKSKMRQVKRFNYSRWKRNLASLSSAPSWNPSRDIYLHS